MTDINEIMAEVMGWVKSEDGYFWVDPKTITKMAVVEYDPTIDQRFFIKWWNPTKNIEQAFMCLEKSGYDWALYNNSEGNSIWLDVWELDEVYSSDNIPLTICQAIEKAKEKDNGRDNQLL